MNVSRVFLEFKVGTNNNLVLDHRLGELRESFWFLISGLKMAISGKNYNKGGFQALFGM